MTDGLHDLTRIVSLSAGATVCTLLLAGCGPLKPINLNLKPVSLSFNLSCGPLGAAIGPHAIVTTPQPWSPRRRRRKPSRLPSSGRSGCSPSSSMCRIWRTVRLSFPRASRRNSPALRWAKNSRPNAGGPMSLADAVRGAICSSTGIGLAVASRSETEAGVDAARAGYRPSVDIRPAVARIPTER